MLKMRDLQEAPVLFDLIKHPEVFPYVRHKAYSSEEFLFLTKQTMEAEENGELISRTILDEYYHPIGTISLFDIQDGFGFLATWIGQPYFGKGYNKRAKEQFFDELFLNHNMNGIFMKVRKSNKRSLHAVLKLPYATMANSIYPEVYQEINKQEEVYNLFLISKDHYVSCQTFASAEQQHTEEEVG
ncbi:GNAT family N-acetyltransferase [Oceanobacillus manasiensis]|uniref:GNAT family N-acetyltransferase n=1 Tax=Oceanobacillus manasiensis TaxID=586413 RepID=UPI0005A86925|nr:GNAT family protein [Oceanobacillus manasiensis]